MEICGISLSLSSCSALQKNGTHKRGMQHCSPRSPLQHPKWMTILVDGLTYSNAPKKQGFLQYIDRSTATKGGTELKFYTATWTQHPFHHVNFDQNPLSCWRVISEKLKNGTFPQHKVPGFPRMTADANPSLCVYVALA